MAAVAFSFTARVLAVLTTIFGAFIGSAVTRRITAVRSHLLVFHLFNLLVSGLPSLAARTEPAHRGRESAPGASQAYRSISDGITENAPNYRHSLEYSVRFDRLNPARKSATLS